MKLMNIKMFALMALLTVTGYSFGYQYGISNLTEQPLIVRLVERQIGVSDIYQIIEPLEKKVFNFAAVWCLKAIEYGPVKLDKKWQGNDRFKGKNILEIQEMGGEDAEQVFFQFVRTFAMANLEMKMEDNEVFKNTAKAATALVKGLDNLACKITDIAMAASTGGATEAAKVVKALASADKTAATESKKEAAKKVTEAKADPAKKPEADLAIANAQNKEKAAALGDVETKIFTSVIDETTFDYIAKAVPTAITAFEQAKNLFDEQTYNNIKAYLDSGKNEDALTAIKAFKDKLGNMSLTKVSIEDEALVYNNINTHMDTNAKGGCSFGLGAIAKASAALTEQSLCQNRDFIIVPTGEKAEKVIGKTTYKLPFDGAVAITTKGG